MKDLNGLRKSKNWVSLMPQINDMSIYAFSKKYDVPYNSVKKATSEEHSKELMVERQLANKIFPRIRKMKKWEKDFYFYCQIYRQRLIYHFDNPEERKQIKQNYYNDHINYDLKVTAQILDNGWLSIVEGVLINGLY